MKKTLVTTAVFLATTCAAQAGPLDFLKGWNKSDYYLGLLISNSDIDGETGAGQDMSTINGTFGYVLSNSLAVEARLGVGSDDANSLIQDPVSNYTAGMLRYHYTWSNNIMAYASVGAALRVHSDVVDAGTQAGAAVAVGLNLFGSDRTALNIEYFYMGGTEPVESIGIGFHHYFGKY